MARRQDLEKRKRILNSAYTTFGELGYRNTTIKEIAEKAGVAAGSIYTYFVDKEMLFRATVEEGWNLLIGELEMVAAEETDFEQKLNSFIEIGFSKLKEAYPLLHGMFDQSNIMQLFQANLERLSDCILRVFMMRDYDRVEYDRDSEIFFTRLFISGILFSTAMASPEDLDDELDRLKDGIRTQFLSRSAVLV